MIPVGSLVTIVPGNNHGGRCGRVVATSKSPQHDREYRVVFENLNGPNDSFWYWEHAVIPEPDGIELMMMQFLAGGS